MVFGKNINDFIEWDYIGAAWPRNDNQYGVGNGGFSLRTKNTMLEIIKTVSNSDTQTYYKYDTKLIPEDVYFTINMIKHKIGKLAPKNLISEEIKLKNKGVFISPYNTEYDNILVVGPIAGKTHQELIFPILSPDPEKNSNVKYLT